MRSADNGSRETGTGSAALQYLYVKAVLANNNGADNSIC